MSNRNRFLLTVIILIFIFHGRFAFAVEDTASDSAVRDMQRRWAQINYDLEDSEKKAAFVELLKTVVTYQQDYNDSASVWIWSAIIKSSYAGVKGGLGALKYAKASKADLEKAMQLDDQALSGSAYTSLGVLYFKVPGWPLAFGNKEKAESLLKQALVLNPEGIDPNYFYGEFLYETHHYAQAKLYLSKARKAKSRPNRPLADQGRQAEISALLAKVEKHLP